MAREMVPAGYAEVLSALKERIQQARVRAALALLYWHNGSEILQQQHMQG